MRAEKKKSTRKHSKSRPLRICVVEISIFHYFPRKIDFFLSLIFSGETMRSINVLVAFCSLLVEARVENVVGSYTKNYSGDFYAIVKSALHDLSMCRNDPGCEKVENLRRRVDDEAGESFSGDSVEYRRKGDTGLVARSYYGGYGPSPMAPALYPAIDTVSVLASLAFLAFLLHSFASLFDRSRSMIPSIVTNRRNIEERGMPDPVKLVLRALDEYDILGSNLVEDPKISGNATFHESRESPKSSSIIFT